MPDTVIYEAFARLYLQSTRWGAKPTLCSAKIYFLEDTTCQREKQAFKSKFLAFFFTNNRDVTYPHSELVWALI